MGKGKRKLKLLSFKKNPEWELVGIFADEDLSRIDTHKRGEFNRMIEECMAGMINIVIT